MGHDKRPTARQVVKQLIAEDGWTGFYRGLGPRFVSMSAWGTSMILAYEYLSRVFNLFFSFVYFKLFLEQSVIIFWKFKCHLINLTWCCYKCVQSNQTGSRPLDFNQTNLASHVILLWVYIGPLYSQYCDFVIDLVMSQFTSYYNYYIYVWDSGFPVHCFSLPVLSMLKYNCDQYVYL